MSVNVARKAVARLSVCLFQVEPERFHFTTVPVSDGAAIIVVELGQTTHNLASKNSCRHV
jgi:hypothetical protein